MIYGISSYGKFKMEIINAEQSLQNYPSKTEKVYELLVESIIKRRLSLGERLVERNLAEKLGVSKTPVREALNRLNKEGLVEGTPYYGFFVALISSKDMEEIYKLREVLEGLAARDATRKIKEEQIRQLNSIIQSFENCVRKKDLECYSSLDLKFHNLLAAISKNGRLSQIMQLLRNQTRILMSTSVVLPGRVEASLREHKKVVNAIVSHKPNLAEQFAREHIKNVKKAVLASLRKGQENKLKS